MAFFDKFVEPGLLEKLQKTVSQKFARITYKEAIDLLMKSEKIFTLPAATDLLFPQIGEIVGGSQREERLEKLLTRIRECGLSETDYDWYCDLRRYGSAPHSGFGLGTERLMRYITGVDNIRDVVPYPGTPGEIEF